MCHFETVSLQPTMPFVLHPMLQLCTKTPCKKSRFSQSREGNISDEWDGQIFRFYTHTHTHTHTHTQSRSERQAERWGAQDGWCVTVEMDRLLPWRLCWTCDHRCQTGEAAERQRPHLKTSQRVHFKSQLWALFCSLTSVPIKTFLESCEALKGHSGIFKPGPYFTHFGHEMTNRCRKFWN